MTGADVARHLEDRGWAITAEDAHRVAAWRSVPQEPAALVLQCFQPVGTKHWDVQLSKRLGEHHEFRHPYQPPHKKARGLATLQSLDQWLRGIT